MKSDPSKIVDPNAKNLAKALIEDREITGASQADVAAAAGVTQQAVSGWESGEAMPRRKRVEMIADYFGKGSATEVLAIHLGYRVAAGKGAGAQLARDKTQYDEQLSEGVGLKDSGRGALVLQSKAPDTQLKVLRLAERLMLLPDEKLRAVSVLLGIKF